MLEQPLGELPVVHEFSTLDELKVKLQLQDNPETLNFVFFGERSFLSGGRFPYLILPDGRAEPLFVLPTVIEPTELGYRGETDLPLIDEEEPEQPDTSTDDEDAADSAADAALLSDEAQDSAESEENWAGEPDDASS